MNTDYIPALTLWEPWASAMMLRLKRNETRSWPTKHRGDLVICSAMRRVGFAERSIIDRSIKPAKPNWQPIYGCALCIVELYDCVPSEIIGTQSMPVKMIELALGNYTPGRFAWLTRKCRVLKTPYPIKGRQGLWRIHKSVVSTWDLKEAA